MLPPRALRPHVQPPPQPPTDAGVESLRQEIRETPTADLEEHYILLTACSTLGVMSLLSRRRLVLTAEELARRLLEGQR